ncbi:ammonium transporter [Parasphingorhabdus flavimaris]|uniref:Ammonium transporter n=1 Tax=Parasphingorhabdus flavimaris TaxID=266812 RepID=A0ABX2N0G7_9SPHN|nr:ammonium transporter [Parasphingorhabdus flavimaris]NVD27190.1 ammonium transporter [Parasphingorhabdus flavimaris]|tara:strand:- start:1294 stop:2610 length:1317 start_codon:yes stop_codon:yes gene_type:complete
MKHLVKSLGTLLAAGYAASPLLAQQVIDPATTDVANSGDTAWILTSSALVLFMTLPGLALFYGGLVRSKNFLSVLIQCMAVAGICSVLWIIVGYTLAFGQVTNGFLGNGLNWMFGNLGNVREGTAIPESTFALFQMTFAVITPALMIGAWVERARFGWVVAFSALWLLVVYAPVTHWIWGGGWLSNLGVLDFAGGIVVHTTAGVSALVVAIMLGKRMGWPRTLMLPHSPALTVAGAAMLWVGWFGFNGGSALTATDDASAAIINTHIAASTAALVWILIEKFKVGKSTAVGVATGAIAGLATITPAAGFVGPGASIIIGAVASIVCFMAVGLVKNGFKIDDSLDVFAVHGVGGILGSLMLALFISEGFGGTGYGEGMAFGSQFVAQLIGVGAVAIWSAVATAILGFGISFILPMRVSEDDERDGLDISNHGERAWDLD